MSVYLMLMKLHEIPIETGLTLTPRPSKGRSYPPIRCHLQFGATKLPLASLRQTIYYLPATNWSPNKSLTNSIGLTKAGVQYKYMSCVILAQNLLTHRMSIWLNWTVKLLSQHLDFAKKTRKICSIKACKRHIYISKEIDILIIEPIPLVPKKRGTSTGTKTKNNTTMVWWRALQSR
jgi:hypothetical protein